MTSDSRREFLQGENYAKSGTVMARVFLSQCSFSKFFENAARSLISLFLTEPGTSAWMSEIALATREIP